MIFHGFSRLQRVAPEFMCRASSSTMKELNPVKGLLYALGLFLILGIQTIMNNHLLNLTLVDIHGDEQSNNAFAITTTLISGEFHFT